jgi:hypothetical protein
MAGRVQQYGGQENFQVLAEPIATYFRILLTDLGKRNSILQVMF